MKGVSVLTLLFVVVATLSLYGQTSYPLREDVATLDGIIKAYYEVVSGPEGPKETARDASLHHPEANVMISGVDKKGQPYLKAMTLKEYHANSSNAAFYEREIFRVTESFGNVTHAWSTYEARTSPGGPVIARGINSIQLYHDADRWWILSWVFDSERKNNPIPGKYLNR